AGQYTSIAMDSNDIPHFSYHDSSNKDLKYAYWNSGSSSWSITIVDSTGSVGRYSSLVIDYVDHSHISYYDTDNGTIKYAKRVDTTWSTPEVVETVGSNYLFPLFTSISVDGTGTAHLIYGKQTGSRILDLQHAYWTGSAWSTTKVDSSQGGMEIGSTGTSIAIDEQGNFHICYIDRGNYRGNSAVKYAYGNGTSWTISLIDAGTSPATSVYEHIAPAIAVDGKGRPHVAYAFSENYSVYALKYAYWNGTSWDIATVDTVSAADVSIALDSEATPHISYRDRGSNDLRYAYWDGNNWKPDKIYTTGGAGYGSSIAIDSNNNPHISFTKDYNSLYYAYWDGSWNFLPIAPAEGGSTSIVLDSQDKPRISYMNTDALNYAYYDGSSWNTEVVDSDGQLAWDT
ncbi:MAG: BNR repeat-containing protein, partial [Desulfobulbaceae bacterium]|nr:BNR repeat-containing protein [Desulfobulbaceae bacterium]